MDIILSYAEVYNPRECRIDGVTGEDITINFIGSRDVKNATFPTGDNCKWNFDVFKVPNELLTENTEVIDDNSFIWWLATRAAVKSTDFHKEYIKAIDPTIAPIPSQELAIYEK